MRITLKDRLSHLTYREVCKSLGPEGERLIRQGGKYAFHVSDPVTWIDDFFRLNLGEAVVTLSLKPEKSKSLDFGFSQCSGTCEHLGAAVVFIGEMFSKKEETDQTTQMAEIFKSRLSECLEKDDKGQLKMTITFPDESILNNLAKSLAQILGQGLKQ
jgi:hypothetical protein